MMERTHRIGRWIGAALGSLVLILALLFYTPPGLSMVARMVTAVTGGAVRIEGLGGFFPVRLQAARLEIADSGGIWIRFDRASLRWSPLALIANHVVVEDIAAAHVSVLQRPIASSETNGNAPRIDIRHLNFPNVNLAASVAGHAVALSAEGSLRYISLHDLSADLLIARAGNGDRYRVAGDIAEDVARGTVSIREGADGIFGKLVDLPGLGPVNLAIHADGDRHANRLSLSLSAGSLRAEGGGILQLATRRADLDLALTAPAMTPRADIAWQRLSGEAHFHGRFDAPALQAHLELAAARFFGLAMRQLTVDVHGDSGSADLEGRMEGTRIPGNQPDLFARDAVQFRVRADLKAAALPVGFDVVHPLASLRGMAHLRGGTNIVADLAVPSLAPFAALKKIDMSGTAGVHMALAQAGAQTNVALNGVLDTAGNAIVARLLGRNSKLALDAVLEGADLRQSHIRLEGAAITAGAEGSLRKGLLDYRLALDLKDLSRLASTLQGSATLRGSAQGQMGQASLSVGGTALLATKGFARQTVNLEFQAQGLPALRQARLAMTGRLDGAALQVRAALNGKKARQVDIDARWKSLNAKAGLTIGEDTALSGKAAVSLHALSDLAPFVGRAMTGSAEADLTLKPRSGKTDAQVTMRAENIGLDGALAKIATLHGTIADLTGKPVFGLVAEGQGLAVQGFGGSVSTKLDGPLDRLSIGANAKLKDGSGAMLAANGAAGLDLAAGRLTVTALDGNWRGVMFALEKPVTLDFAGGMAVDQLALRLGGGTILAAGRVLPQMALTVSAQRLALQDFAPFLPKADLHGNLSARANLQGTLAAPQGNISLEGSDLHADFSSLAMASAVLRASAQLAGDHAIVDASLAAGANARVTVNGTAPLAANGVLALHTAGLADLKLLDPFLAASGRRMRGMVRFDATIGGTASAPRVVGNGRLSEGEFQDYLRGVRLYQIDAAAEADGAHIRLTELAAHAGQGRVTGSGSIDLASPGMPVDLTLKAAGAQPISSNLITATVSGDIKLRGHLSTLTTLSGEVQVTGGEINLPENFPPEVAVLNVRRRGQPPPAPPAPESRMALDVAVHTIGPVFVRGHGMDAEMGGDIHVNGTTTTPAVSGGFQMNRGSYSVAGQTLNFTTGRIRFDGTGLRERLDPTLDFVAQTISGGVTATLSVGGYASAPKISLSSSPVLPQDEVIAHLLFQQSVKQLTPLQLASIAQAVAAMGGVGGGFNPLGTVRRTLGLDRLSVGSVDGGAAGSQTQTTVEAGRYVARDVYVGVKQNLSGGTQTRVQVDITRRLKAQATASTASTAATTQGSALQDNGSSVGLSYQFEY